MNQFDLKNKFEQIVNGWKITNQDIYLFNNYYSFLKNYNFSLLCKEKASFSLQTISESLIKLLDLIFTNNYIESNYQQFNVKLDNQEAKTLLINGFDEGSFFTTSNLQAHKHKKDVICQINKIGKVSNGAEVVRLDFSLLDKKYTFYQRDALGYNLSSLVNALDKQTFLWSNVDIKHQNNSRDLLFATVNINVEIQDLCETAVLWLTNTSWAAFMPKVQEQIKLFCQNNNHKYHYSTKLSIKAINNVLKNINFQINENFLAIYQLYIKIRDIMNNHKSSKGDISSLKEKYKNLYHSTFELLLKKSSCLYQLIYLNKTSLANTSSEEA